MDSQLAPVEVQVPTSVSSKRGSTAGTSLHGRTLVLVRAICIILVVYTLSSFGFGFMLALERDQCTGLTCVLPVPEALVYVAVAALIFWRKSDDWMALLAALMLVLMVPVSTLPEALITTLFLNMPVMRVLIDISAYLAYVFFLLFIFLFPNGQIWPRWSLWLFIGCLFWFACWLTLPVSLLLLNMALLLFLVVIIAFNVSFRYAEIYTPIERQQTKWVLAGMSVAFLGALVTLFTGDYTARVILLLIPITIGIAVLRYRLYDIDVIIRRTLIYTTLTVILGLLYFGLVIGLEALMRLFTGQVFQYPVIIVASTLFIAALFQPLRHRIQDIIDHRFYRSKYDAAKIFASFSTTLGREVDLDQLRKELLNVVQEAMQPTHVSLWLQEYGHKAQHQHTLVLHEQAVSVQHGSPDLKTGEDETTQERIRPPSGEISRRVVLIGMATGVIALAGGVIGQGLLRRFPIFVYTGHTGTVYDAVWSPDGERIASSSADKTVQVWNALDGNHVFTYRGHSADVYTLAWSPDGRRIASCSADKTVQVWDVRDGNHLFTYHGHKGPVIRIAWSIDGTRLASAGGNLDQTGIEDPTVQVWEATTGKNLVIYRGHRQTVTSLAWSPDATRLASGGADNTVQVWDARDGHPLFTYRGHTSAVFGVSWSPDGERIASGSWDKTAQAWDAANGEHAFVYNDHRDNVFGVSWAPDSKSIASASADGTVQIWRPDS